MIDPVTIGVILSAIAGAAKVGSDIYGAHKEKKFAKKKAKEMKRGTYADVLNSALQRGSDLESMKLDSSARKQRRRTQSLMNTAAGVRESLNL